MVLLLAAWAMANVLLLVFAAVLFAVVLRALADFLQRLLPIGDRGGVLLALAIVLALLLGFAALLGTEIWTQGQNLVARLPTLLQSLGERLGIENLPEQAGEQITDFVQRGAVLQTTAGYSLAIANGLASAVLVLVGGVYFALEPGLYRRGLLLLFPPEMRPEAGRTLDDLARGLRLWLIGRLVAMVLVGVMTGAGLWFLGVESALALGFLAGLLDFIPVYGPFVAAVPAVAIAFVDGGSTALWVAGLYLLVQQIEGNLIDPMVQKRAMDLPPALTLFSIVAFGVLFGPVGVLLAAPLAAVSYVAVTRLWVKDVIGEDVKVPGEAES